MDFERFDRNGDGVIDRQEWAAAVAEIPAHSPAGGNRGDSQGSAAHEERGRSPKEIWGEPRFHSIAATATAVESTEDTAEGKEIPRASGREAAHEARRPREPASWGKSSYTPPKKSIKEHSFASKKPPQATYRMQRRLDQTSTILARIGGKLA